jgi:hypothetical protein
MAIERISKSEFATIVETGIQDRDPTMDTTIGPIRDLRIDPFAEVLELQNNRVAYLSELNSMNNAKNMVPDDLDSIIFNESMVRWNGSSSITVVTFARAQPPTSDLEVPVNFPLATLQDASTGKSVLFRTIETKTMYAATASSYYNSSTSKYELDVTVSSVLTGAQTVVGAYSIKVFRRSLPGFDECYNKLATESGNAIETNERAADRYLLHIKGSQLGTPTGNETFTLDNFSAVEDVYTVYGNDVYLTREESDAGACDVWIMGSTPLTAVDNPGYPGVEVLMPLENQPLISVTSVVSGSTTFVEGVDYEVVYDTGAYSRSSLGIDGIRFLSGGSVPASIGTAVTITYQYNSLMNVLSSFFAQPAYYSIGMDRLFRWSYEYAVAIQASLKVYSGNPSTIKALVNDSLFTYINSLRLGANVEEFDLEKEVSKIAGIDNFVWSQLSIAGGTGVGDLTVAPYEHATIVQANLIINLVT